jgi:hypothetical protein
MVCLSVQAKYSMRKRPPVRFICFGKIKLIPKIDQNIWIDSPQLEDSGCIISVI